MKRRYSLVLTPEPDGSAYNVVVPALSGCLTWGATVEEALAMAHDAVATFLDGEAAAERPEPGAQVVANVTVEVEESGGVLRVRNVVAVV